MKARNDVSKFITKEVRAYVLHRQLLLIGGALLLIAIIALAQKLYIYDHMYNSLGPENAITFLIITLILPIVVFRWDKLFSDKTWYGTVTNISYASYIGSSKSLMLATKSTRHFHSVTLTVEIAPAGESKEFKIQSDTPVGTSVYSVGDKILRYKGTHYPVIIASDEEKAPVCPICGGGAIFDETRKCQLCGTVIVPLKSEA